MMYGTLIWCLLWAPLPVTMPLLCVLFSARRSVLECQCQPFSSGVLKLRRFVFFSGCGLCVNVFLVQLLHDVWNFNLVSLLGPSTRQNAASLNSLFCKALCFGMSVSAIQFRRTQAPLCFVFFCGRGLCMAVFLVQLLHDVWNFNMVSPLGLSLIHI